MLRRASLLIIILFGLLVMYGCSSPTFNPVGTEMTNDDINIPLAGVDEQDTNRSLIGSWDVVFDLESNTAEITQSRNLAAHMNITSLIPQPSILINDFNPVTNVVDVDFTISNPYGIDGYDVRLILHTDNAGHMLLNPDEWTELFDIPAGMPINPFKAFAKDQTNRIFAGGTEHTENLLVLLPGGNPAVSFAVDASFPGNAQEPYEISGFTQGTLEDLVGSSTQLNVTVKDWQNDTNAVNLHCPAITGGGLMSFSHAGGAYWQGTLTNSAGAPPGNYNGYVIATSTGSGALPLYDQVEITVVKGQIIDAPGDVRLKVNRNIATDNSINVAKPFTLYWSAVADAEEYAVYYDYEPANPDYFVLVDTVPSNRYYFDAPTSHIPPNHWVKGYKYVVRARAVAGDPSSESPNSEVAFVMVSSFDSLSYNSTLNDQLYHREGWTTAVQRTPYSTDTGIAYWPTVTVLDWVSEPHSCNIVPTFLGANWTVDTGQNSDFYPGKLLGLTYETPFIQHVEKKQISFAASCRGTWDCDDLGGVIVGSSNAPQQPMDGWDGSDFRWAPAGSVSEGFFQYNWRHYDAANPFPFNMQDYVPPQNNCWRWQSG